MPPTSSPSFQRLRKLSNGLLVYVIVETPGPCSRCGERHDLRENVCDRCRTPDEERAIESAIESASVVLDARGATRRDIDRELARLAQMARPS